MVAKRAYDPNSIGCYAGWRRYESNPLIGEKVGNVSDPCVIYNDGQYLLYYTHRYLRKILVAGCEDGFTFRPFSHGFYWAADMGKSIPARLFYSDGGDFGYALNRHPEWGWETAVCQPFVLKKDGVWHMWYTGKHFDASENAYTAGAIGHAISSNGHTWESRPQPVLKADQLWESVAVQYPSVIWNEEKKVFEMWYSGGDIDEPNGIGYAQSADGDNWVKHTCPVLTAERNTVQERYMVNACHVVRNESWLYMFYTAWQDASKGRICLARSHDGITWQRHPLNPIVTWGQFGAWDVETVFGPYVLYQNGRWLMYYTGHSCDQYKIGCFIHDGDDLGFDN